MLLLAVTVSVSGNRKIKKKNNVEESNPVEQSLIGSANKTEATEKDIPLHAGTKTSQFATPLNDGEKDSLPPLDRPLQLVRPDLQHHQHLEIVTENLQLLHRVDNAVAVVAVVGKFHTGKSFLLNQLMGKKDGFGIGPTVRPQTMGIWMWGKVSGWCFRYGCGCSTCTILDMLSSLHTQPWEVETSDGKRLSVIFLDTEGIKCACSVPYDAPAGLWIKKQMLPAN